MVVDYNIFNSSKGVLPEKLPDNILWVLEQIPNNTLGEEEVFYIL